MEDLTQKTEQQPIILPPPETAEVSTITDGWDQTQKANIVPPPPVPGLANNKLVAAGHYANTAQQIDGLGAESSLPLQN